jgi:regulatory protein
MAWAKKKPKKIVEPLDEKQLFDYAVGSLGRRMRTVMQLTRLMRAKVEKEETGEAKINAVILRLKEYNFLDDAAFATTFTRLRQDNQHYGRRRVQQDLLQKGIHPELATETLNTAYEDISEEALARQHLARKRLKQPTTDKESRRIMGQLIRAGFSPTVIFKILKQWKVPDELLSGLEDAE